MFNKIVQSVGFALIGIGSIVSAFGNAEVGSVIVAVGTALTGYSSQARG